MRIGLACLPFPGSAEEAVDQLASALKAASEQDVKLVCTPENYLPGLRGVGYEVAPPDPRFLARATDRLQQVAAETGVHVIVGTERPTANGLLATALVLGPAGVLGWQDKVQLDPSEDGIYTAGSGRRLFELDGLRFGVCICHEGWRYPETVRWAARRGAHVVFHPHFSAPDESRPAPTVWAEPTNSFHEKAALCRAAENHIYFATVNYAIPGSATTSAVVDPAGSVIEWQPYGMSGLLVAELDCGRADGLLAHRLRAEEYP